MKTVILALSNPIDGKETEFNDWYTNTHLKEVVRIEGIKSAQRFRLSQSQMLENQPFKYLAIYEIDSDDISGTVQRLNAASEKFDMQPVIDMNNLMASIFQSITDVIK